MSNGLTTDQQLLLEEWKDIRETLRYFGNIRFAQLTVFIAATVFLFEGFFGDTQPRIKLVLGAIGIVGAALFIAMEYGAFRLWRGFASRGKLIEAQLAPIMMMKGHRDKWGLRLTTGSIMAFYAAVAIASAFGIAFSRGPDRLDAGDAIVVALAQAQKLPPARPWRFDSLTWNGAAQSYQVVLVESTQSLLVDVSAADGQVLQATRKGP